MENSTFKMIRPVSVMIALSTILVAAVPSLAQVPGELQPSSGFRQFLRRILREDEENDPPATSRGPICLVTPSDLGRVSTVWHDKPTFVWQGPIGKLEVLDAETDDVLWQYLPTEGETSVLYAGEPLQGSKRYKWLIYGETDLESELMFTFFEILPSINRLLIANGLTVAENQTDGSKAAVAIARADYFSKRSLRSDAIQSLFAVEQDSTELLEAQDEIISTLCD